MNELIRRNTRYGMSPASNHEISWIAEQYKILELSFYFVFICFTMEQKKGRLEKHQSSINPKKPFSYFEVSESTTTRILKATAPNSSSPSRYPGKER